VRVILASRAGALAEGFTEIGATRWRH